MHCLNKRQVSQTTTCDMQMHVDNMVYLPMDLSSPTMAAKQNRLNTISIYLWPQVLPSTSPSQVTSQSFLYLATVDGGPQYTDIRI
jgi:hypothetical protein